VTILLPPPAEPLSTRPPGRAGATVGALSHSTCSLLAAVVERLYREYECCLPLSSVTAVIAGCVHDIQATPVSALPELTERLARHRLAQIGHSDL
jgi:hypothetical protein